MSEDVRDKVLLTTCVEQSIDGHALLFGCVQYVRACRLCVYLYVCICTCVSVCVYLYVKCVYIFCVCVCMRVRVQLLYE